MADGKLHSGLTPDGKAEMIERLARDGEGMVLLTEFWLGDDYEVQAIVSGLTISPQATPVLRREGDWIVAESFFPAGMVSEGYRAHATDGAVRMPMRFELVHVTAIAEAATDPRE